jgi:hypothetical protein
MPRKSARTVWREQRILDVIWEHRFTGGVTSQIIAEETAPEDKNTGISGAALRATLWTLYKRGQVIGFWRPSGRKGGARFSLVPGVTEYKIREKPAPAVVEIPPTTPTEPTAAAKRQHYLDLAKERGMH